MTDEERADIEMAYQAISNDWRIGKLDYARDGENITRDYMHHVRILWAEVERLRARETQLLAIIDGMSKGTVRIMSNRAVDEHGNEYPIIVEKQP